MNERLSLLTGSLTSIFASDAITDVSPETVGSALVNVETKAYEADYQDITFDELLPVINLNDETATSFEYMYVTKAGKAQLAKGDGSIAWVDSYLGAKNVKLYAAGASDTKVFATESIEAKAYGASDIDCQGSPKTIKQSDGGATSINIE